MIPKHLRCEYLVNPLGIDRDRPRLSWIVQDAKKDAAQSAYQILVADHMDVLAANHGHLWDTGKVSSEVSVHHTYAGTPLTSGRKVFWKVRIWDSSDNPSAWSEPAWWEMGLLTKGDWHGRWIAATRELSYTPAPLFRKAFQIENEIDEARVYVAGVGYYELYVNGQRVGDRVLDPAFTNYQKRILYSAYRINDHLQHGENVIGVMLGTGWYNVHTLAAWEFHKAPWRQSPRFLLEMRIRYKDGSIQVVASDASWSVATGPIVYDSIYSGEIYDARLEKEGWGTPGYEAFDWPPALVVDEPAGSLRAQMMPPIKIMKSLAPKSVVPTRAGEYLVDFGQNFAGWPRICASGPAGTKITLQCDERLEDDPNPESVPNDIYVKQLDASQRFQTDVVILKGQGQETYQPRFTYHGFQYVRVTGFPGTPTPENFQGQVVHSAVETAGHFECSNELLNRIWCNTRWSHISNLHGYPTDCPHREKNGWTGDAHLAAEQAIYNYDMAALYTKWLADIHDAKTDKGDLPGIIPTAGWGRGHGAGWDSAIILIPWYLYLYYGDIQILDEHYDMMRQLVDYLSETARDFIIYGGLGDWCPAKDETPTELVTTGCFYTGARLLANVADLLGKAADREKYCALSDKVKHAFNGCFFNPVTGLYANGTQTALSTALFHGLAEPAFQGRVFENLIAKINADDGHLNTGIFGTKYLLQVLTDFGRCDVAYQIAGQTTFPGWGYWIKQGATTLWERWNGINSRNHIMFGDISAWFFKALAGINPDPAHPGFRHILIRPHPVGDLKFVRAEYNSIRGRIATSWHWDGSQFHLETVIPGNCTATVGMPDGREYHVGSGRHTWQMSPAISR